MRKRQRKKNVFTNYPISSPSGRYVLLSILCNSVIKELPKRFLASMKSALCFAVQCRPRIALYATPLQLPLNSPEPLFLLFFSSLPVKRSVVFRAPVARSFGAHASHDEAPATHGNQTRADGVVIPELVETLEWVLDSPPNVHQFEEPPVSAARALLFTAPVRVCLPATLASQPLLTPVFAPSSFPPCPSPPPTRRSLWRSTT